MSRIVVLGAGESGAGAAVLAKVKGFDTFVSDMSAIKDKYKEVLDKYGIAWEEGQHTEELILSADEVVKSPGIPNDAPMILKLKEQGTPIISEIEFAGRYTNAKMICITGSNGKTTTRNTPQRIGISNSLCMIMANTAMMPPIVKLPVSPMNTCAGYALYHRKPINAPIKAQMKITSSSDPGIYMMLR